VTEELYNSLVYYIVANYIRRLDAMIGQPTFKHGELWTPGKPPLGFKVAMLQECQDPVAIAGILPSLYEIEAVVEERIKRWYNLRILAPDEDAKPSEEEVLFWMPAELEGKPETVRQFAKMGAEYHIKADWERLPDEVMTMDMCLRQLVRFTVCGEDYNLYNMSNTHLDEVSVGKVANALRYVSGKVGGLALRRALKVMAVVPIDHETMYEEVNGEGRLYNGIAHETAAVFSEGVFDEAIPRPPYTPPKVKSNGKPFDVRGDRGQIVGVHEIIHTLGRPAASGSNPASRYARSVGWVREATGVWTHDSWPQPCRRRESHPASHPYQYGDTSPREDIAVTATADFAGGDEEARLDPERRLALSRFYAELFDGEPDPALVTATELPLPRPGDAFGLPSFWPPLALRPTPKIP
jgi:hypothetical protein